MKKQIILVIIILLFLLSACGQTKFDKSMRNGKDALQQGNYEESIKHFDTALIEKPTDEDAKLLMERARKELNKKQAIEILKKYQEDNSPNYAQYFEVYY